MSFDPTRVYARRPSLPWQLMGVLTIVLAVLTALVAGHWSPLLRLDTGVVGWTHDLGVGHDRWIRLWEIVAVIVVPTVLRVVLLLVAIAAAVRKRWRPAVFLVVLVVTETVLGPLSKYVVDRPRPTWAQPLTEIGGYSYPSGHAVGAGMFTVAMVLMTISAVQRGLGRRLLCAVWWVIGLITLADRLLLAVHYPTDVVSGFGLGALMALLVWHVVFVMRAVPPAPVAATVGPAPSRFAVVVNPIKVVDRVAFEAVVEHAAQRHGWQSPLWLETLIDDPGVAMTEEALAAGVDMVMAAGGDGTVRVVCSELARTGVPVGVVPLGTGNLLARNLGIPLYPADAVDIALAGQDRAIDVVRVHGDGLAETHFTVMAGLGLDAAIMQGAPDDLKARMGWSAYVVSALRQLRYPAAKVTIEIDDQPPVRSRARTVVIGNVGQLQAGIPLLPDARPDDGVLDVVVIAPLRTLGWLGLLVRVLRRNPRTDERLDRMTGRRVVVRAEKPLPRQLDGDPIGEGIEICAEIQAGTLLVRSPADSPLAARVGVRPGGRRRWLLPPRGTAAGHRTSR